MADTLYIPTPNWPANHQQYTLLVSPEWPKPHIRLSKTEWICQSEKDGHTCIGRAYSPAYAYRQWVAIMNWSATPEPWKETLWQRFLHWWGS